MVLALFEESRCRREACARNTLPVPVILNRLATAFFVLLREMGFGMGGRKVERCREKANSFFGNVVVHSNPDKLCAIKPGQLFGV